MEVTNRTFQGRYLLLPRRGVREIVLGVLGRAQRSFEMPIHAFTFVSNHFHLLLTPRDAEHLADFMELFESKLAREMNRLHGWAGALWGDRYHSMPIENDEETLIARLQYVLSHGVKEDLVERADEWPGAHCVGALTEDEPLQGKWYDRTAHYEATRWGKAVDLEEFAVEEEVRLSPLPCWLHLSKEERQDLVRSMVEEIEADAVARHRAQGTRPAGVQAVLAHHPHERPNALKHSPRPWFHTKTREGLRAMQEAYRLFAEAFHDAAELLIRGHPNPTFPEGSFPPGRPFVPHQTPG
jgi:REP element-mobilizing transposase RayT